MATTAEGIRAAQELDELYRAHAAEVYRYVYAVLGNRADAEDVTQTTFVNALRALERGERPRKPTNWLITIAHNLIRQRWRQEQSRPREVELDREVASFEADDSGPSIDDLVRALQRIPSSQREALVLRELEGRSYKEIASILDVSLTALETLIFRARRSLAEELENLVTCDRAELALSQQTDGRLGRKERKRLVAHLDECPSCARIAASGTKHRRAFKGLALLPLPLSLSLFQGAPSAAAATGLPAIGAGAAAGGVVAGGAAGGGAGVGGAALGSAGLGSAGLGGPGLGGGAIASGVAAKVAVTLVAVTIAGAGYEGVQKLREPVPPAKTPQPAAVVAKRPQVPAPAAAPIAARVSGATTPQVNGRRVAVPGRPKSAGQRKAAGRAVAIGRAKSVAPAKAARKAKALAPAKAVRRPRSVDKPTKKAPPATAHAAPAGAKALPKPHQPKVVQPKVVYPKSKPKPHSSPHHSGKPSK